jgi:two-component system sensor histidine kinase KdpD
MFLVLLRPRLNEAHVSLVLLLVVLGGSAYGGRALGITLALLAFFIFDVWFLQPYNTLVIANPFDWIVLLVFLVTGIVGAQLLERQRRAAEIVSLRHANRLKDALLASVSHDLRTPLTTIKGLANEIARGGDADAAFVIEEEADRLSALVEDLLDLSQLSAGELPVLVALNTAEEVIGASLQRVEPVFSDRPIETQLEGEWTRLVGRFDFSHVMRILTNLIENAAKYSPPGTPITIRAWRDESWLRFSVEDKGAGIAMDSRERVFEPFVRGENRPGAVRGTGLGLSIARQLSELQGGTLSYEPSAAVESRFVLSVPAADVPLE